MNRAGRLSNAEFDRVVSKFAGSAYTGRPFAARRENLGVADHLRLAAREKNRQVLFLDSMSGLTPYAAAMTIYRAATAAASNGKKPLECTLTISFPIDEEEKLMRLFMTEAAKAAEEAGLLISDINFKRANIDIPEVTVSVFGTDFNPDKLHDDRQAENAFEVSGACDKEYYMVFMGSAAIEGSIILRELKAAALEKRYSRQFLNTEHLKGMLYPYEAIKGLYECADYIQPVTDGGVFAALWELSIRLHLGMKVDLKKIFVDPLTVEICELLDISPYTMMGGGVIVVTDKPEAAVAVCTEAGQRAAVIGVLNKSNDKIIVNEDEIRYLETFRGDTLIKYLHENNNSSGRITKVDLSK